jgi:dihydrolipoamide dehydrogenase
MSEKFDCIIIGAGPGGHAAADAAARAGKRTAIIEKDGWGGTCTHRGCIPTKALLACSRRYADVKKFRRLGISLSDASFDFGAIRRHQLQMTRISALGVEQSLKEAGVDMKEGRGEILSPHEVLWTPSEGPPARLHAEDIVIAWGSEPLVLPGIALSERIVTSDGLLAMDRIPGSILIVGGSVIGVEFATWLAELGVQVTLIELMDQLLPAEDAEASALLAQELTRLGVRVLLSTRLDTVTDSGGGVSLTARRNDQTISLAAEIALICTGRKPRLPVDELKRLGIRYERTGLTVDSRLRTNIPTIFAVGDVTGGMMLAHRAGHQGRELIRSLYGDGREPAGDKAVPSVVYSHPAIARVGLTECEAKKRAMDVEVVKVEYAAQILARTELAGQGFAKALFREDRLIGITIVGELAGELIANMSLAVACRLDRSALASWVIPHPSLSELFTALCRK